MKLHIKNVSKYGILSLILISITLCGCEKYLDNTPLPASTMGSEEVFLTDNTTSTVVTGIYLSMGSSGAYTESAGTNSPYTLGLYADETKSIVNANFADVFYKNAIQAGQSPLWSDLYKKLFAVNTAMNGINTSKGTLEYKNQWLGECYFLRAYFYYLLVNYYGDLPLALTDDYTVNNQLSRVSQAAVYQQIIADLKQAQTLLSVEYKNGYAVTTTNRFRPNRAVATALLARMYLYTKEWANAEAAASELIANTQYALPALNDVFLANSKETIWALATGAPKRATDYSLYNNGMPATLTASQTPNGSFSVYSALSNPLLSAFEATDGRRINWVRKSTVNSTVPVDYYFPNKYKSGANSAEYLVLFRLAEQYLIRAEARAMQGKTTAADDVNAVRRRAGGISDISSSLVPADLLAAIAKERQVELFTEGGHRFFDLKRTGAIDAVMTAVAPSKGTVWQSYMSLWPIPPNDIRQNPKLSPNPGYLQ